jgi:hypothetical protein
VEQSEQLEEDVSGARQYWERKRSDPSVPGAPPPESEGSEDEQDEGSPGPQDDDGD